jgi:hypothetical protein
MKRVGTFNNSRYNNYVPACGYAADVVHGAPFEVDFGTPAAADADAILNDQSIATAGSTTTFLDSSSDASFGQNVTVVASGAATSTVTVHGFDCHGQPMSEQLTLNGTTPVVGVKAFKSIAEVEFGATGATTIDLGWGSKLGVPYRITHCLGEQADGVAAAAGTVVAGVRTDPQTVTTVDPRGCYTPTTTANGSKRLKAFFLLDGFVNSSGNGGLQGIAHVSTR